MNIKLALVIITLPPLITGVIACFEWHHEYLLGQLEQRGQAMQAVVTESNPPGGSGRLRVPAQLVYDYSFAGRTYTNDCFVANAVQQRTKPGDSIKILFLSDAPDVSKPVGFPKIFLQAVIPIGLIVASVYAILGICFFFFAYWKLCQIDAKRQGNIRPGF